MAYYAALVSAVQLLKEITHHDHPYSNYVLDKQQLHLSLSEKFNLLQELLEDYSRKDLTEESADTLESRIRDVAYQTQDTIESYISDQIHAEDKPASGVKGFFRHLISAFREAPRHLQTKRFNRPMLYNIAEKEYYQGLEKVKGEVDSIVEELMKIKDNHTTKENLQLNSYTSTDSVARASKVQAPSSKSTLVGFEEHLNTIKAQLCGEPSSREVISIVGMGGLGKSTLARNIFDDKLIDDHFDCRAWITVSQNYHLRKMLLAIVDSLNMEKKRELMKAEEGLLGEQIYKYLKGRRYLIVIDDIWETKGWDDVKRIFPDDNNGSRVITTTRLLNVAAYADNYGFIHELQFLNENQSWNLFYQKVTCPPDLDDIGRLIAKNCRGLPLAIVVIAGVLSKVNKTQHNWEEIARNVSSAAVGNNADFSKILSLSYDHLPHYLKPCLLYLGGFPEDHEIPISKLIKLWVAEGFLKPIASKSLEEVGEEYFKDLVNRNLVAVTKKTSMGKFKRCTIHDLLRDLCLQRAHAEKFCSCIDKKDIFHPKLLDNVRRLYISYWKGSLFRKYTKEHASHLRAILFFHAGSVWRSRYSSIVSSFKLLRVLDSSWRQSSKFSSVILKQLHLRYLALSVYGIHLTYLALLGFGIHILHIPPSISKLQNLQTLIVDEWHISLPSEIWKMPQLRHVMIRDSVTIPPIPYSEIRNSDGVPLLGMLQTLSSVYNFRFTCDTIQMIPCLKKLKVRYSDAEPNKIWEKFGLNNLFHLHQLENLETRFGNMERKLTHLPENFAFPTTLIKLSLWCCGLPWEDIRAVGSLPNLQVLKLISNAFVGEEWEPVEGEFVKLKILVMDDLHDFKYWRAENTHFPCLEKLHIVWCYELEEIPSEIGDISTLQLIEVRYNNSTLDLSALKIQEEQRDLENNDLEVRIISRYW